MEKFLGVFVSAWSLMTVVLLSTALPMWQFISLFQSNF